MQQWTWKRHTSPQRLLDIPAAVSFEGALRDYYGLPLEHRKHMEEYAFRYGQHFGEYGPMHRRPIPLQPSILVEPPSEQQLRSLRIKSILNSRADATRGRLSTAATDARRIRNQPHQSNHSLQRQLPLVIDLKSGSSSQAAKREANRLASRRHRIRKQNAIDLAGGATSK